MDKDKRKTFVFYRDWYDTICKLDDQTGFELSKAIMAIAFGEEPQGLSDITNAMLMLIRPQIERDITKWMEIKSKRQESGKMGGLAKQANATKCYQMLPNATKSKQDVASVAVNVDVNDNVDVDNSLVLFEEKEDTNVFLKKKTKGFVKPTVEEIQAYIIEKGYTFDAEAFFAFYESNGWKVGRNPMKNWKMACTTWAKNHKYFNNNNTNNYGRAKTNSDAFDESIAESNEFSQILHARFDE